MKTKDFMQRAHFSNIPEVNDFFRSLDGIYHDPNYQKIVEEFWRWQQKTHEVPEPERLNLGFEIDTNAEEDKDLKRYDKNEGQDPEYYPN